MHGIQSKPFYRYQHGPYTADLFEMIDSSKKLVEYFKRLNLQSKLTKTLKQENVTRWNSLVCCLCSILDMLDEIVIVLQEKNVIHKLNAIQQDLLNEFTVFLEMFQHATLEMEVFKRPTLHKVAFWHHRLQQHMKLVRVDIMDPNDPSRVKTKKDYDPIISLKEIIQPIFEEKFVLQPIHVVAMMLDPIMKMRLRGLGINVDQIDEAKEKLKAYMIKYSHGLNCVIDEDDDDNDKLKTYMIKKAQINTTASYSVNDDLPEDDDEPEMAATITRNSLQVKAGLEFMAYMANRVSPQEQKMCGDEDGEFDVLKWWGLMGIKAFPIIALVMRSILCISAANTMSENNFQTPPTH
ncbi:uncharacterized protein LOC110102210 [Dendrobium catenatum]|uniref:uncharacterized protein LOC110102210 n=1 Tax=Dendrobium catenatum TaxID=906689 RepID=UPI0009F5984E|nr:uncharacterized protein LOC110102210 [Dendrobium catenatum]